MSLTRRALLAGAVTSAAGLGYARRSGFTGSASGGGGRDTLTFATWGSEPELAAFRALAAAFEEERPGIRVELQVIPFEQMYTDMDAQLQAGRPPDVFRCDYTNLGMYSGNDQLLDLSPYLDESDRAAFLPALWSAVTFEGRPYAMPHHTDTSAVLYRKDMFADAGITSVPDRLADAWSWEEFDKVALRLRSKLPGSVYPFTCGWQQAGAYRWLTWLFAAGGRLLSKDLERSALPSPEAAKALEFTSGFFDRRLVPPNSSVKTASFPGGLFSGGTVAMAFAGDFLLPTIVPVLPAEKWGVTFQPRDAELATDLGGNTVAATRYTDNPELAADWLKFLARPANMSAFCERTMVLPTLRDLLDRGLDYPVRSDLMGVYTQQATTLTPEMTAQTAVPAFGRINATLQDELESAFVGGKSVAATLAGIDDGVREALAE